MNDDIPDMPDEPTVPAVPPPTHFIANIDADEQKSLLDKQIIYEAAHPRDSVREKIKSLSELAVRKVAHKMTSGNDKVEFMAARDILDRAGFREPEKKEHRIIIEFKGGREWFDAGDDVINVTPERKSLTEGPPF